MDAAPQAPPPDTERRRAAALERIAALLGWSMGILVTVAVLAELGDVCLLVFAAVLLACVLRGAAERLSRPVGLSPGWALALIVLALAAAVGLAVWLRGPALVDAMTDLAGRLNQHLGDMWSAMDASDWGRQVATRLRNYVSGAGQHIAGMAAGVATSTLGGLGSLAVLLVSVLYLAASPGPYLRGTLAVLPPAWRPRGRTVMSDLGSTLRWWFVGQLMDMLVVGTLSGIGLALLGVPLASTLGVVAALCNFVPYVGALAGAVPAVFVALGQGGTPGAVGGGPLLRRADAGGLRHRPPDPAAHRGPAAGADHPVADHAGHPVRPHGADPRHPARRRRNRGGQARLGRGRARRRRRVVMRGERQASASFLKKRSKKLLPVSHRTRAELGALSDKVFLLLFLQKKKILPSFPGLPPA